MQWLWSQWWLVHKNYWYSNVTISNDTLLSSKKQRHCVMLDQRHVSICQERKCTLSCMEHSYDPIYYGTRAMHHTCNRDMLAACIYYKVALPSPWDSTSYCRPKTCLIFHQSHTSNNIWSVMELTTFFCLSHLQLLSRIITK